MAAKQKQILSENFVKFLIEYSGGYFSSKDFEKLISLFEVEAGKYYFTKSSEANILRIIESLYDRVSFLYDCLKYPHHAEITAAIAVNSEYLTDVVVRNPEYLHLIFSPEYLNKKLVKAVLEKEISEGINRYKSFNSKLNFLKLYKRRTILKIGLNDLLGNIDLKEATRQLSILAKAISASLFSVCYSSVMQQYGINFSKERYCLAALGKLGGNELNYSSDVDLILFYDKNSIADKDSGKEYHELLSDAAQLFIQSSTEITSKGYVYRVDFRLRPDGKNSPICRTVNDFIKYYETRGEYWERQMLIKLSFVGGSNSLYNQFEKYRLSFVYPASFMRSPSEQIKLMKENIERSLTGDDNIKLFPGGIRDIEFAVQALQMINGGKIHEVQCGNTLEAIEKLKSESLLSDDEADKFISAYIFYRRIEHYLQLMNDIQTHNVPARGELLEKLTVYCSFSDPHKFENELAKTRKRIRSIFNAIVKPGDDISKDLPKNIFDKINFIDKNRADKNLEFLRTGKGLLQQKKFDAQTISLFSKLEIPLYNYISKSGNPDKIIENFSRVITKINLPSIWYGEFKHVKFFESFLKVCEYSQRAIDMLAGNNSLDELYLTRKVFAKDLNYRELTAIQVLFILSVQFALRLIDNQKLSKSLSGFCHFKLKLLADDKKFVSKYFIAGLGSFGSAEMGFSSDVDLIVVAENTSENPIIQSQFQVYLAEAEKLLKPLSVDFRLRPEGKKSPLVWDINGYTNYLSARAQIWEYQSLIKLNFVTGDKTLFDKFKKTIIAKQKDINPDLIQKEIHSMYKKIFGAGTSLLRNSFNVKKSRGGILSIDLAIHYLILKSENIYGNNIGSAVYNKFAGLIKTDTDPMLIEELREKYNFLKTVELSIQNILNVNNSLVPADKLKLSAVAKFLKFKDAESLSAQLNEARKAINSIFNKIIER